MYPLRPFVAHARRNHLESPLGPTENVVERNNSIESKKLFIHQDLTLSSLWLYLICILYPIYSNLYLFDRGCNVRCSVRFAEWSQESRELVWPRVNPSAPHGWQPDPESRSVYGSSWNSRIREGAKVGGRNRKGIEGKMRHHLGWKRDFRPILKRCKSKGGKEGYWLENLLIKETRLDFVTSPVSNSRVIY